MLGPARVTTAVAWVERAIRALLSPRGAPAPRALGFHTGTTPCAPVPRNGIQDQTAGNGGIRRRRRRYAAAARARRRCYRCRYGCCRSRASENAVDVWWGACRVSMHAPLQPVAAPCEFTPFENFALENPTPLPSPDTAPIVASARRAWRREESACALLRGGGGPDGAYLPRLAPRDPPHRPRRVRARARRPLTAHAPPHAAADSRRATTTYVRVGALRTRTCERS